MDRVGNIYYRRNSLQDNEAIMVINKLDGEIYHRDIWGINKGDNYVLYVNDDITVDELEYLFDNNNIFTFQNVNNINEYTKRNAVGCLFKSKIERGS